MLLHGSTRRRARRRSLRTLLAAAVVGVAAATFTGVAFAADPSVTLTATPSTIAAGGTTTLSGTVSGSGPGWTIQFAAFSDAACTDVFAASDAFPVDDGPYAISYTPGDTTPHTEYQQAFLFDATDTFQAESSCIAITVIAAGAKPFVPEEANVFLCYSTFQTDPGVWGVKTAAKLLAEGYWQPWAIAGNVPGGTNVGGYHLVCSLAAGQAATGAFTDGAGGYEPPAYAGMLGIYPIAR
jgi:hypothetical protein